MATRGILTYSEMMCPIILNRHHEIAKCPTVPQAELLIPNKCLLTLKSLQLLKSLQNFRDGIDVHKQLLIFKLRLLANPKVILRCCFKCVVETRAGE